MTVRLTVAQALVRFLASQYTERDGVRAAADRGLLRHLRPRQRGGRRPGPAPGPADRRGGPAVLPGPQRAGHGARLGRLRPDAEPAADLRLHRLDRPRLDQHGDRRRARHHQPHPGAAAAQRLLRHPGRQPGAAGARGPALVRRERQRRVQAGVAVLGPDQPAGAAAVGAAGRDAGAHRPGRDRRGDPRAAAGRAGRGLRLAGGAVRRAGLARAPPGARACRARARRRGAPQRPQAAVVAGGGVIYSEASRRAAARSPRPPASRSPTPRRARARWPGTTRAPSAASAPPAPRSPTRWPARPTSSSASAPGTATSPPPRAPRSSTRTCSSSTSTWPRSTRASTRAPALVADARAGLEALTTALTGYHVDAGYTARIDSANADWRQVVEHAYHLGHQPLPAQTEILGALNEFMDERDVVVQAAGSMPGDLQMLWRARDPKQYHVEYGYSCMGYEIAGGARRQDGRPGPRGLRARRRRVLPDDGAGDRHRGRPRGSS